MAPDGRLVVMAKYPAPGRVKTRLAAAVGDARAAALSRAFILDLADRLREVQVDVTWAYWPPGAPFAALLPGWACHPQRGEDLGARLLDAVEAALCDGVAAVVVIGADVPHVPMAALTEAFDALRRGVDVVVGPARDGGYYLIGVRGPWPALFTDMPWSTDVVLGETMARAQRLGLRTHLVAESFDVDDPRDLETLRRELRAGTVGLPRTAALLADDGGHSPP